MKIVFTVSALKSGGAERVVSGLANSFVESNHEVFIIMLSSSDVESSYYINPKIHLVALNQKKIKLFRLIRRVFKLRRVLSEIDPDIVISFLSHICIYSYYSLLNKKIPLIVSERNDPNREPKSKFLKSLRNHVFKKADGCVFQLVESEHYFHKKLHKSVVISNPVFIPNIEMTASCRRKAFVLVGSSKIEKNRKMAYLAFSLFKQKHSDYRLEIFGESTYERDYKILNSLNIVDSVDFLGIDNKWHQKAFDATGFILTSDFEGMPNALLEAMCLGIPCISTDCPPGGPRCILNNGQRGILVKCDDYKSMSNEMTILANDSKLQKRLSLLGRQAITEFDIQTITKKWLDFIKEVVAESNSK